MAIASLFPLPLPSPPPLPTTSDRNLIQSLLRLSREISLFEAPRTLQRRSCASAARKSKLLALLFEDLIRDPFPDLPRSAVLCFREILVVLQRFKALLGDCSTRSRTRLLLQAESLANEFNELTADLSTLLDILPLSDLDIGDDVKDVVGLVRKQCRRQPPAVDLVEEKLRSDILSLIREIEKEIVPDRSRLEAIFEKLGLDDSRSCKAEIESLEREIGDRVAENWTAAMVAMVGLVRYSKCVLFGASTPRPEPAAKFNFDDAAAADPSVPADFRCPISLELMTDPVVVASGQTYDRESISRWIASGHATCPKTGQVLPHTNLIPNRALKSLIALWCRDQNLPFDGESNGFNGESNGIVINKAALEAARMTASFLVEKLAASPSTETANRVVHELRQLAKNGPDNRAFVAEAGAIPLLLPLLAADDPSLQVNAVTALLNLSILDANKKRIMHTDGAIDGVIHVLSSGATWRAKENAAATILSLSSASSYRRRLGRNPRVVDELVSLVKSGPTSSKKDALAAILSLAADRENIPKLIDGGVVGAAIEALGNADLAEEAVAVVAAVAKRGGEEEVGAAEGAVGRLVGAMRNGSDSGRENAAAALVVICRRMGSGAVAEVARTAGIEWVIWEVMGSGTERARRKAAALGRMCRRWVAAVEEADRAARYSAMSVSASTATAAQS